MLKMNIKTPQTLKLNYSGGSSIIIDDLPKENSKNAVSSGGVYQGLKQLDEKINNINLSDYAKKNYVDEAVKNVKVDLTGYATEEYVNKAIENVDVDLTDYYTKEEINETLDEKVETSFDEKLGDIDLILDEIINGSLEVDNKEY